MRDRVRDITSPPGSPEWLLAAGVVAAAVGLAIAEVIAAGIVPAYDIRLGLWLHGGLLLAFLAAGVLARGPTADLFIAMAVLPLIRLLSYGMPLWLTAPPTWFAMINVPLIVSVLVAARTLGYGRKELGLVQQRALVVLGLCAGGILIGSLERLIIQPAPLADSLALADIWWPVLSLMLFTGLSEELLFRGVLQTAGVKALGVVPGIVFVALLFGIMHMGWLSALDLLFVFAVGLLFGWVVHRTGSIIGVTIAHGVANVMLFIVLPLALR